MHKLVRRAYKSEARSLSVSETRQLRSRHPLAKPTVDPAMPPNFLHRRFSLVVRCAQLEQSWTGNACKPGTQV